MSGVAAPQFPITKPFGAAAVAPGDITLPIPVPSQAGVLVGAASFEDGFPAATRTDPTAGGVAPYGQDFNGIMFMMSVYCAISQAGQIVPFNAAAAGAIFGYAVGARVASITTPGRVWRNILDGNTNDPDVNDVGWSASDPLYGTSAPAAGTYDDVALPGASDYALDVDTAAGDVTHTGFVAQRNGQRIFVSNIGVNLYNLASLTGSAANNQIRCIPGGLTLIQYQSATLEWVATLNKWLIV